MGQHKRSGHLGTMERSPAAPKLKPTNHIATSQQELLYLPTSTCALSHIYEFLTALPKHTSTTRTLVNLCSSGQSSCMLGYNTVAYVFPSAPITWRRGKRRAATPSVTGVFVKNDAISDNGRAPVGSRACAIDSQVLEQEATQHYFELTVPSKWHLAHSAPLAV